MPLQWKKLSEYALADETGDYRISRARVGGEWVYTAWRIVREAIKDSEKPRSEWVAICYVADLAIAKSMCESKENKAA
jgi:hypothetical protein